MRHNKNFNHLGRQAGHRKAMLSNMATSLILHKRIETTVAKAKAVQRFVEPLVTKSKEDTTHSRRIVFSYLKQKEAVTELFRTIAPKISERPGALRVHVNPLVVERGVGEKVDLLLRDRQVVGNTQLLTYVLGEFVEIVDD